MVVKASILDEATRTPLLFDLTMSQQGPPLIVWGTGVSSYPPKEGGVLTNNYYYSLTRLQTSGTVIVGQEVIQVSGMTWMDHEYGYFGSAKEPVLWFLQDMQLDNGVHISHYQTFTQGNAPKLGERKQSNATVQFPDGTEYFLQDCWMTPNEPWTSLMGTTFFLKFKIEIPAFDAVFEVTSLMADQDFPMPAVDVYEGVAKAVGTFQGKDVTGTAWNEQKP
jgi:predicted secreted hydrolase